MLNKKQEYAQMLSEKFKELSEEERKELINYQLYKK